MRGTQKRERELLRLVEEKTADLRRANDDLQRLSSTDSLTGLANRRVFDRALERGMRSPEESGCRGLTSDSSM